jgi:glycosyltransferase involved in cell wall biosynthesis
MAIAVINSSTWFFLGTSFNASLDVAKRRDDPAPSISLRSSALAQSQTGNPDVSVVVLTYNSGQTLQYCLSSVVGEKPGEIIAVDRLSTDGTISILKRYCARIFIDRIGSLGYSRQVGVEAAKGAFVMFVDSDVRLSSGCIKQLRRELLERDWVGIHARLLSAENSSYWQKAEDEVLSRFYSCTGLKNFENASAALFRKEILMRYPLDPNLRDSSEDRDLCYRLVADGHRLGISSAIAYHYHRREFAAFFGQRFRYGLGDAQLGLKYRKTALFLEPLVVVLSEIVWQAAKFQFRLVPYWATGGLAEFAGVLTGLVRSLAPKRCTERKPSQVCIPEPHFDP